MGKMGLYIWLVGWADQGGSCVRARRIFFGLCVSFHDVYPCIAIPIIHTHILSMLTGIFTCPAVCDPTSNLQPPTSCVQESASQPPTHPPAKKHKQLQDNMIR